MPIVGSLGGHFTQLVDFSEGCPLLWRVLYSETSKKGHSDTPKEDKPPNKGQTKSSDVYTLYTKQPLKEDNLSTKCPLFRGTPHLII